MHISKNVYNLYNQRILFFPDIDNPTIKKTARFDDICSLYAEDIQQPLKLAHKLTAKTLEPKNIKKTSVKLAAAVFHNSTFNALQYFSAKKKAVGCRQA